jgi:hypothetical protein
MIFDDVNLSGALIHTFGDKVYEDLIMYEKNILAIMLRSKICNSTSSNQWLDNSLKPITL